MKATPRTRVVVLLGTNFSGSHLLSHLLSAHPRSIGVGEIHRFQQLLATGAEAPVVSEYQSDPLFAGLADERVSDWHRIVQARFSERFGIDDPIVVDNSKKVAWARTIAANLEYDVRFVHLVRDPRALVLRWSNTYSSARQQRRQRIRVAKRTPSRALRILRGDLTTVYLYKWLRENRQISSYLHSSERPSVVLTYRDMVFDTESTLAKLMPGLGLEFDPAQLRFGEGRNFGTTKTAHADAVQRSEIRPDLKWQAELSASACQVVEANGDLARYLAAINLCFTEDGLTEDGLTTCG